MIVTLLAAKAALVLSTALAAGQVPHPADAHPTASAAVVIAVQRPTPALAPAPHRKATDGALD